MRQAESDNTQQPITVLKHILRLMDAWGLLSERGMVPRRRRVSGYSLLLGCSPLPLLNLIRLKRCPLLRVKLSSLLRAIVQHIYRHYASQGLLHP